MDEERIIRMLSRLTAREKEIFVFRAQGLSIKEIAEQAVITQEAVHFHLGNIYEKLELKSLPPAKRFESIRLVFYPVYLKMATLPEEDLPPEPDVEYPEVIPSQETMALVRADETALVKWKEKRGGALVPVKPIQPPPPPPPIKRLPTGLILGIGLGLALSVGGFQVFGPKGNSSPPPVATQAPVAQAAPAPTPTALATPVPTIAPTVVPTATATAKPKPKPGEVIYAADWSNGLGDWGGADGFKALSGQLLFDGTTSSDIFAPIDLTGISDYDVEADVQIVQPAHFASFAFKVRVDGKNCYNVGYLSGQINCCPPARYFVGPPVMRNESETIGHQQIPQLDTANRKYRIELRGNTIRLFVNDSLKVETQDNRYLSGNKVGFSASKIQVVVKNFKVTAR